MFTSIVRHQQSIAWFFVAVFYLELILVPVSLKAEKARNRVSARILSTTGGNYISSNQPGRVKMENHNAKTPLTSVAIDQPENVDRNTGVFTSGPTQPEMQSFQSVNGNNLVDLFTGDFSYNIPLLDVGGYPINLHYQSGISMDQEASWVGLGWNINPGTINRNMRGLPDDFNGEEDAVIKTLAIGENKTTGVSIGPNVEIFGRSTLEVSGGFFYNNNKGWGTETGINANINAGKSAHGTLSAGLSLTNSSQEGFSIDPSISLSMSKEESNMSGNVRIGSSYNSRTGIQGLQISGQVRQQVAQLKIDRGLINSGSGISSYISFSRPSYTPSITVPFTSRQTTFTAKTGVGYFKGIHGNMYVRGYQAVQKIEKSDRSLSLPAYGYLYYEKAKNNEHVLLDMNREKDIPFREKTPHIAIPIYTYDTYSITGEGTGGMFRPYRGDIGYTYDHAMSSKSGSNALSVDLGFGSVFHGGADFNKVYAVTKNNPWKEDNAITSSVQFTSADSLYENVYFKNPGEKTGVNQKYLDLIGNDSLIRVNLSPTTKQNQPLVSASRNISLFKNARAVATRNIGANTLRQERDKRTQMISFLTAQEARVVALDTAIKSFHVNEFPCTSCNTSYDIIPRVTKERKEHHLSEITVLNPDGRRYIYGLPVYNLKQADVTMAVDSSGNTETGLVGYTAQEKTEENRKYYSREELSPYAHSFLISGILAPDYVDITGDGISEDDNGDAVKFNYTRVYGGDSTYAWRAPFQQNKASYNEGQKTDNRDQKASYTYGEKEIWYLNSVESKTMIATFVLDTEVRQDAFGVNNEDGGLNTAKKLFRLKEINLYTKADFLKNGAANARPIKTVHFSYSYNLCKKNPSSESQNGKLTLEKVWFTYNKNNKGNRQPYTFVYANNPNYKTQAYDRWGNYKNSSDNPGTTPFSNADFSYTLQKGIKQWDSAHAADSIAPWTLTEIKLPSGGKMKVTYESDDYAYVQNKRAMQFFSLAGFGSSSTSETGMNKLYSSTTDYNYVFINVPDQVATVHDIQRKYLQGISKLFFKLYVQMPRTDRWGNGYELIPCYANIDSFGVKGDPSQKKIWIKLGSISTSEGPLATAALQYLRLNLPSKAYPYSEPGDNLSLKNVIGMIGSVSSNLKSTVSGYGKLGRSKQYCKDVDLDKSFVRLTNPFYKKLGGGLRVKKIEIYDHWNTMTSNVQQESKYGQQYDYSTTISENGIPLNISSGVASYEPMIGGDENPFHVPIEYKDQIGVLAPTDYLYTEEPFAETFFPAPVVGYSKVRVQTIHKDKKSATGVEETEFYTAKEFPTIVEFTPLDNESKKTYNPPINKFIKVNAKHFVTLSQGFKVELNDMHGKLKSQTSYAQNDLKNPVSYTHNYYRTENDNALNKKLSNTVSFVNDATGVVTTGDMGKEVELMIDVREQTSTTVAGSVEANVEVLSAAPPIITFPVLPLPSYEKNQYRSISVLKIVNRYGILDSIEHIEKGSRVTTRNVLFDAETGEALLSQTNNEFDDPIFNFNYPAHWAYSGMGPAYKNTGATFRGATFIHGRMMEQNGLDTFSVITNQFESGDEVLAYGRTATIPLTDSCTPENYSILPVKVSTRLWVINAAKGKEGDRGLFFIDKDGKPYTAFDVELKVIRSGRRNMAGLSIGTVTSLKNPIKTVNDTLQLVFDSTTGIIASQAARFKDLWTIDSTSYRKDTLIKITQPALVDSAILYPADLLTIKRRGKISSSLPEQCFNLIYSKEADPKYMIAENLKYGPWGCDEIRRKSYILFNLDNIPVGATIESARVELTAHINPHELHNGISHTWEDPHQRNISNSGNGFVFKRINYWPSDATLPLFFEGRFTFLNNALTVAATSSANQSYRDENALACTALVQDMSDNRQNNAAALVMELENDLRDNRVCFHGGNSLENGHRRLLIPKLIVKFYKCPDSASIVAQGGNPATYTCYSGRDSFVCKPNMVDSSINPYRWGMLGNWKFDRAYTYFGERTQSDPWSVTNIRKDGDIKSFIPYWSFSYSGLQASNDTSRWVWNSESTVFNSKGSEIENHDPLDRYNSGLYGYNKTLPIAVAQNSKSREMFFEGMEDYDYKTDTCKSCPPNRFFDIGSSAIRVDSVSHTGRYSLRVNGNQTTSIPVSIATIAQDTVTRSLSVQVDSIPIIKTVVTGAGTGLLGDYRGLNGTNCKYATDAQINKNWHTGSPWPGCPIDFKVYWTGYIQPRYTDDYIFHTNVDDFVDVIVNGVRVNHVKPLINRFGQEAGLHGDGPDNSHDRYHNEVPIRLEAGQFYEIKIEYWDRTDRAKIRLDWESSQQIREVVPTSALYPPGTNPSTFAYTTVSDTTWCVALRSPKQYNLTNSRYSPLQGTKLIISGWVKEQTPSTTGKYNNVSIQVQFNTGSPSLFTLTPKGNIIEGWQRIEDTLTIPSQAVSASINLKSLSADPVYFDDLRVHPFKSNMKSFVYNPVNLRLMAELDENNYATFYEYDDDGTLIRLKKETERGIKTIRETRSGLLKQ